AGFTTQTGFSLSNAANLQVSGPVADGVRIQLATTGALGLQGSLTAPRVTLTAGGPITQGAGGISTAALDGSAGSAAFSSAGNTVTGLGSFASSGGFTLQDSVALTQSGTLTDAIS